MNNPEGRIGVLGNGSWSSALVKILTDNGQQVNWWMRSGPALAHLRATAHNAHYLKSVRFDLSHIEFHEDLENCVSQSDILLAGIPSAFIADTLSVLPLQSLQNKTVLSAIKGILPGSYTLFHQYLETTFQFPLQHYACIAGPCHAEEIAAEKLSYLTFAAADSSLATGMASRFQNSYLQTVVSEDIIGVQYAAVLKNIYALGAGIAHGLDYGDNFLSVFITNGFAEMQTFLQTVPEASKSHYNSSVYLGDLLVTCYSLHSRNRTFGNYIGKGYSVHATQLELNMVAEGYYASKGIHEIALRQGLHLPIAERIYRILWEQQSPAAMFSEIEQCCH